MTKQERITKDVRDLTIEIQKKILKTEDEERAQSVLQMLTIVLMMVDKNVKYADTILRKAKTLSNTIG